jgi:pimeloyl-ACP methyl ester carboxylesterase
MPSTPETTPGLLPDLMATEAIRATTAAAEELGAWWRDVMRAPFPPLRAAADLLIADGPLTALRDFSDGAPDDAVVPTLVLPPQAGHHSSIVDFSPRQSQMQTIRAAVADAVERIGGPVNLVGDCQGGWLAANYAALHPEAVHTLTVARAPIDFHAGRRAPIPAYAGSRS